MAGKFLSSSLLKQYKKIVETLRNNDLKTVAFIYRPDSNTKCPNCNWDPVGKRSSGVYNGSGPKPFTVGKCPVCRGAGQLGSENKLPVNVTRVWLKQDGNENTVAGVVENNIVRLRAAKGYLDLFRTAKFVELDNAKFEVDRTSTVGFDNISCEVILRRSE